MVSTPSFMSSSSACCPPLLPRRPKVLQKKLPARSPSAPSVPTLSSRLSAVIRSRPLTPVSQSRRSPQRSARSGALFLMPRSRSDPPPPLRARVTSRTCLLIIFMKYSPCYFFINAQRVAQVQGQGRSPQEAVIMQTAAAYHN